MEWMRGRPRVATAAVAVGALVVLILVWLLVRSPQKPSADPTPLGTPTAEPTPTELPEIPTPTTSATTLPTSAADLAKAYQASIGKLGSGLGSGASGGSGTLNMPGLQGGSLYKYLPKHRVMMRVTSEAPIGTVGYIVPTSLKNSTGTVKNVGGSWSLTTFAYGQPDYAQLFMQAGARGYPITCTITVDGHVTEHRSTQGPYGQLICQG
jgi:hypothetical protein